MEMSRAFTDWFNSRQQKNVPSEGGGGTTKTEGADVGAKFPYIIAQCTHGSYQSCIFDKSFGKMTKSGPPHSGGG